MTTLCLRISLTCLHANCIIGVIDDDFENSGAADKFLADAAGSQEQAGISELFHCAAKGMIHEIQQKYQTPHHALCSYRPVDRSNAADTFPDFSAAAFLEYEPMDVSILIAGFAFGPLAGLAVTAVSSVIQGVTVSAAVGGWVGILMALYSHRHVGDGIIADL